MLSCGTRERKETEKPSHLQSGRLFQGHQHRHKTPGDYEQPPRPPPQHNCPPPSPFKIQEGLADTTLNRATTPCSHLSGQHHPWLTQSMVNTVNTAESHFLFSNCLQAQLGKAVGARLLSTGTGVQEEGLLLPQLCKEQNGDGAS